MVLNKLMNGRYAVKLFDKNKKVSDENLNEIKEVIRLAPTSFGLQPFKVKIVEDKATKDKLQVASWNQPQVGSSSHVLVFCAETDIMKRIDEYEKVMMKAGMPEDKRTPFINIMRSFFQNEEKSKIKEWSHRQAYFAADHAMLKAVELGFNSCPMEGFDPNEYKKILKFPENLEPAMVLPIGYPADEARPKMRFDDLFI